MNSDSHSPDSAADPRRNETSPAETVPFRSAALTSQAGGPATSPSDSRGGHRQATLPNVFGRFRIERQLGQGGMGAVLLAHDTQLNRPVALKVPVLDDDGSGTVVARFLREARAVASLNHPNICQIYDVGQLDGTHFIAMAYIEGRPLSEFVQAGKPQPQQQVAQLIRKVALALHEAHEQGLLHRDLKPANIMVNRRGEPIVMDFGLACRVAESAQSRLTHEGHLIGTPAYMSPEQINDRQALGPATDIYSLGVVMYELLAGRAAFSGSVVSVIAKVLHDQPTPLVQLRSDISPALAAICARAMAKSPGERFASMKELAIALSAYLKGPAATGNTMPLAPLPDLSEIDALAAAPASAPLPTKFPAYGARSAWPAAVKWAVGAGIGAVAILLLAMIARAVFRNANEHRFIAQGETPATNQPAAANTTESEDTVAAPANNLPEILPPVIPPPPPPIVAPATEDNAKTTTAESPPETEAPPEPPPSNDESPLEPDVTVPPATEPPPQGVSEFPQPIGGEDRPPLTGVKKLEALRGQFDTADKNHDGQLDRTEVALHVIFRADKNGDEVLDLAELRTAFGRLGDKLFGPPNAREIKKLPKPPNGPQGGPPNRPALPR